MADESPKPSSEVSLAKQPDSEAASPSSADRMRPFNYLWTIVAGLYFLLVPWPLREFDWWSLGLVIVHALLFVIWFYYRNNKQNFLAALIRTGIFTYGISMLLIAVQARGWTQSWLMNPYFVAPRWNEIWFPAFCLVGMIYVALSFWLLVTLSRGRELGITLGLLLLACLLGLLVYYHETIERAYSNHETWELFEAWLPVLYFAGVICVTLPLWIWFHLSRGSSRRWMNLGLIFLVYLVGLLGYFLDAHEVAYARWTAKAPREDFSEIASSRASDFFDAGPERKRSLKVRALDLLRWSFVDGDSPSEAWLGELKSLLQTDGGAVPVNHLMRAEPIFQNAVHHYWTQLYGLNGEIDSKLAWETLERLGTESLSDYRSQSRMNYVVESVAPHLDSKQLIDRILKVDVDLWPPVRRMIPATPMLEFRLQGVVEKDKLKPFLYAAWWLDQKQNAIAPDEYNEFGNRIGHAFYCREQAKERYGFIWRTFCHGRDYDEYLLRRNYWSLGTDVKIGNTTVKSSERALIFIGSKGGREWRRNNRNRLLELASKSITPAPEPKTKLSRGARLAFGALAASISLGSSAAWPTPPHLDFLFGDPPTKQQPSLAFEFWPEFDTWITEKPKLHSHTKLQLQWNYLAKMWPESSTEMFVDCYMKTPPTPRQYLLLGAGLQTVGLPRTIPAKAQLEILQSIKSRVSKSAEVVAEGYPGSYEGIPVTKDEIETIDVAIALVECPEGAATFVKLLESRLGTKQRSSLFSFDRIRNNYNWELFPPTYGMKRFTTYMERWLNLDCLTKLTKHKNPELRRLAVEVIDMRPIPEYMGLLELLQRDSDEKVKEQAEEVTASLEKLRKKSANQ